MLLYVTAFWYVIVFTGCRK